MDFSGLVQAADFSGVDVAVMAISLMVVAVLAIEWGVKTVLALVGGGDEYDSAGFDEYEPPAGSAMEAVYARAAAMAAAGEGQSEVFRHNTVTAAYDAGYSGGYLGDSVDPAAMQAYQDGQDARREDEIRYGDL